jgi:hypothetical protein
MPAASARGSAPAAGLLGIGQVLSRLTPEFPTLTSSKLRFLEVQGIVTPTQRDHYLPLGVIRDYLEEIDAGRDPLAPGQQPPPTIHPQGRRYRRDELLSASGAAPQLLNEAISTGILPAAESYGETSVTLLRSIVALDRHGIEPRHVRALRQSAERDVSLIEQALAPLLHRTDASSRARASEVGPELARRLDEVRAVFVRAALSRLLP